MLAFQPPGQGEGGVDQPVLEVGDPDVPQRSQSPFRDESSGVGEGGHPAVVEADHGDLTTCGGLFGGRRHRLGLGHRVGERLLAQHVLAGFEGGDGDLRMTVARGADVDELDVVAGDQGAPVGLGGGPAVSAGGGPDGGGVPARDGGEDGQQRQVEDAPAVRQPCEWAAPMNA